MLHIILAAINQPKQVVIKMLRARAEFYLNAYIDINEHPTAWMRKHPKHLEAVSSQFERIANEANDLANDIEKYPEVWDAFVGGSRMINKARSKERMLYDAKHKARNAERPALRSSVLVQLTMDDFEQHVTSDRAARRAANKAAKAERRAKRQAVR